MFLIIFMLNVRIRQEYQFCNLRSIMFLIIAALHAVFMQYSAGKTWASQEKVWVHFFYRSWQVA